MICNSDQQRLCWKIEKDARRIGHLTWMMDAVKHETLRTDQNNVELVEALWAGSEVIAEIAHRIEKSAEEISKG